MTTWSGQVSQGNQDAHEADDGSGFNSSGVTLRCEASTTDSSRYNAGCFFNNVNVPGNAIVSAAYESVVFPASQRDSPDLTIYGNAVDSANEFVTEADVTSRAVTDASVAWSDTDLGSGSFVDSPDLSDVIIEIIGRAGWLANNDMVLINKGDNTTAQESGCRFTPYDQVTADACKLTIEYELPGGIPLRGINHPAVNPLIRI